MGLSKHKIDLLREFVNFTCSTCKRTEFELSNRPHRIKQGGEYTLNNISMNCDYPGKIDNRYACHKIFTSAQNKASGIIG